jgi:hypothetical protein
MHTRDDRFRSPARGQPENQPTWSPAISGAAIRALTTSRPQPHPLDHGALPRCPTPRVIAVLVTPANTAGPVRAPPGSVLAGSYALTESSVKQRRSSFRTLRERLPEACWRALTLLTEIQCENNVDRVSVHYVRSRVRSNLARFRPTRSHRRSGERLLVVRRREGCRSVHALGGSPSQDRRERARGRPARQAERAPRLAIG